MPAWQQLLAMLGALFAGTLLAELFGAANMGVALGVGTLCFMATTLAVMLLADRSVRTEERAEEAAAAPRGRKAKRRR